MQQSPATPPVTIIMPACDEEDVIVDSVRSVLKTEYPGLQVCVVDDGSSDATLRRLIDAFDLSPIALISRPRLPSRRVRSYFVSREYPNLLVISKDNGGKPDALNAGLNMCRTPYFCTLDSDCILERDALLRLMWPVVHSPEPIAVSGGIVRVLDGCDVADGQVMRVDVPRGALQRFQVVEYLRSFLFGRTAWDLLGGTVIVSGAFALFHRETVVEAGGFLSDTVTEDMELVLRLHRWAARQGRVVRTNFTSSPVCWAQCPPSHRMLERQRRRWQLGLCQTLWKHRRMILNPKFGTLGLFSLPFQLLVEALGAVVEPLGYVAIAFLAVFDRSRLGLLIPILLVGLACAAFFSVSAIVLEEMTYRRYRSTRNLAILLLHALVETFSYRQLTLWYRFQGVVRFLRGFHDWEKGGAHRCFQADGKPTGKSRMSILDLTQKPASRRLGPAVAAWPIKLLALALLAIILSYSNAPATSEPSLLPPEPKPPSNGCEADNDIARRAAADAPSDLDAALKLARALAACRQYSEAISACRRALAAYPDDRDLQLQIARLLAWDHRYDESISAFRDFLKHQPNDREALEGLARVQAWSGKLADSAVTHSQLASAHPESPGYLFEAARLEAETHQYPAARDRLASLLAVQPGNLEARLLLAQLELKEAQYSSALRQFERVLQRLPTDPQALMGAAQANYYVGDLRKAHNEARALVAQQPKNFDALFLLASIERAQGHPYHARLLLHRAERISPHNSESDELREKLRDESSTVLHTAVGYTREIGNPGYPGAAPSPIDEDLRSATYASTLDFTPPMARSNSSFSWSALPTESPSGIIAGAAAPTEFLYRQTTRLVPWLTLRGGVGIQRFGPGVPVDLPNSVGLQPSATTTPVGFMGGTFAANSHFSLDLTRTRAGITYTPLAVRLGVVSSRTEGGINITFDPRTDLHLTYFREHLATMPYEQLPDRADQGTDEASTIDAPLEESGSGGALTFNRRVIDHEGLALDAGYSMTMRGYDGDRRGVYLGFFAPNFYERELFNTRFTGHFTRRFGYDFSQSVGVQQVGYHQSLKEALLVNPALTFRATPYVAMNVGCTHYDSAQSLGIVRGNGIRVGIDYRLP